ncbi:hypothetical protein FRC07_008567 [Ceratobasidium sp. 392]|nr:hypothetical protein FRC07_008567 [Ceratobasidium sp. 392]
MHPSLLLFFGAGFATIVSADPFALPPGYHRFAERSQAIDFRRCGDENAFECGRFEVPLDYQNSTAGKASLAVVRLAATQQPRLGTLFVNPGGPGGSGVDFMFGAGREIMQAAGGQYDVVSWDPRGVGLTNPRADCFRTGTEENTFWQGTIPRAGLEARGNFTDPEDLAVFNAQVPQVDVLLQQLGEQCLKFSPNTYEYVGSVAVVRDLLAMNDYLEGPNKTVNFWGLSYGTLLGSYLVNMFPDRVGRVIIDGVLDPVVWSTRPGHEIWNLTVESVDEAFTGFVTACAAAGPAGCALASPGSSADSIRDGVRQLIDRAYDFRKITGPNAELTSAIVRNTIYNGMYQPKQWPGLAQELRGMSDFLDNPAAGVPNKRWLPEPPPHRRARRQNAPDPNDPAPDYAFQAVACADSVDAGNVTTQTVFDSLVDTSRTTSQMCWNLLPSLAGNEADPATPFISAKRVADALGDSATLIEQDDFGHLSLAMHSDCTMGAVKDYFLNNTVPSQDKFCGTNQVLFPGPGITKNTLSRMEANVELPRLRNELEQAQTQSQRLAIAVVVLASTVGLLLLSLVAWLVRGLTAKLSPRANSGSDTNGPNNSPEDERKLIRTVSVA